MLAVRALAVLAVLLAGPACGSLVHVPPLPPVPPEVLDRTFTAEEAAADLDELFAVIEEVHPDPYGVVPREELLARRQALLADLPEPLTRASLQPRFAELVAALGDGHTSVYLPVEEFWRDPEGGATCFPIDVAWDEGAIVVRRTAAVTEDGALGPGARLLEIDGRPAAKLFQDFLAHQSGETLAWRAGSVERSFPVHLWLAGLRPPYALRVVSALDGRTTFDIEVPGLPWNAIARGAAPGGGEPWRLERRADGSAVLVIDSLSRDLDEFEDFLEETFTALAADPPTALVIDLRRNGGGNSALGDELLQYLSDQPWRQAARKDWKASARMKAHLKSLLPGWIAWLPVQYLHPVGWKIWGAPDGSIVVFEDERIEPRDEPLRYRGPVAWLIGPGTFSSAMGLACGARDCGRGLLVGATTGGVPNGFGEVIPFRLTHTQLGAQVSSALFVRPDGAGTVRGGIEPDVACWPAPGADGDPVLLAALAALQAPDG